MDPFQYPEKTLKSEVIYDGKIIQVHVETVELPNRKYAKREVVEHGRGVGIIAVTDHQSMYMVRQYRAGVHAALLEIPAGLVEPNENPSETATRELREEIGFRPAKLEYLFDAFATPGYCSEKMSLFLATGLVKSPLPRDDTEFLEVYDMPIEDLFRRMNNFEIVDAKTIIGIQYAYYHFLKGDDRA